MGSQAHGHAGHNLLHRIAPHWHTVTLPNCQTGTLQQLQSKALHCWCHSFSPLSSVQCPAQPVNHPPLAFLLARTSFKSVFLQIFGSKTPFLSGRQQGFVYVGGLVIWWRWLCRRLIAAKYSHFSDTDGYPVQWELIWVGWQNIGGRLATFQTNSKLQNKSVDPYLSELQVNASVLSCLFAVGNRV